MKSVNSIKTFVLAASMSLVAMLEAIAVYAATLM